MTKNDLLNQLRCRGTLFYMSVSQAAKTKTDKEKSRDANDENNSRNLRVVKALWNENDKEITKISSVANRARNFVYSNTIRWTDNGWRLIPIGSFVSLQNGRIVKDANGQPFYNVFMFAMDQFKTEFTAAVEDAANKLDILIDNARDACGNAFNLADYPDTRNFRAAHRLTFNTMPIPYTDAHIEADSELANILAENMRQTINGQVTDALKDCYTRLFESVKFFADKMASKDGFHKSAVDNMLKAVETIGMFDGLLQDSALDSLAREIRIFAEKQNVTEIRGDETGIARATAAKEAANIVNKISGFLQ